MKKLNKIFITTIWVIVVISPGLFFMSLVLSGHIKTAIAFMLLTSVLIFGSFVTKSEVEWDNDENCWGDGDEE